LFDNEKDPLSELKDTVPKLDSSSREMLLTYAAGMIAQKELQERKNAADDNKNSPVNGDAV